MSIRDLRINILITVNGHNVARWKLVLLGVIVRMLHIPLEVVEVDAK